MENDVGRFRECSSRNKDFSLRGKFTPLNDKSTGKVTFSREKARERHVYPLMPIFPKSGLISPRYRMMFTRDNFTSPRVRFFSLREKIVDNFTSPRHKVGERHVYPVRPVFPRGGPSSPRYKVMSPRYKFTSPKDMVGNKPVFSREEVSEKEKPMRCIIPPMVSPGQRWHVVQHKKFGQRLSRTQKRRM